MAPAAAPSGVGGAVLGPLGAVGLDPFRGPGQAALFVAQRAFEPVPQDMQAGTVAVGGNVVGQGSSFGLDEPTCLPAGDSTVCTLARITTR